MGDRDFIGDGANGRMGNIKMTIHLYKGRSDLEVYLVQGKKIDLIFGCHNDSEEKKVNITVFEFTDYAIS